MKLTRFSLFWHLTFVAAVILIITLSIIKINSKDNKKRQQVLTLFNWGEYLNPAILQKFEKETGIQVKQVLFASNELAVTKIKSNNQYDLVILSEYAIDQLMQEEKLEQLDKGKLTQTKDYYYEYDKSFREKILKKKKLPDQFDSYAIPYFMGKVVLLYNTKKVQQTKIEEKGFKILEEKDLKVALCNNSRDGLMVGLKATEAAFPEDEKNLKKAKEWLLALKKKKPDLAFINDQLIDRMSKENQEQYDVVVAYSGDAQFLKEKNKNLAILDAPSQGTNVWVDALVIPKGSQQDLAYQFINFLRKKENYQANLEYMKYNSPYNIEKGPTKINITGKDTVYKYDAKNQKLINTYWNDIIAFPSQKDYWLFLLSFLIFASTFGIYLIYKFKKGF
ncbi:extracellular solute-binding protein [Candidatus Phytoplasma meliae]|uniref:Extracellular solute-binding protein n=1 Tax=Candidatus Phytoplasma meliae TaxID=1848402 RepID=A0ABS5CYM1_9MOLU|nr:extracellular solute-binding protein [Candidatus Phytoplasma meliae]MBP5836070.1 extracellular solute-binding protein [Candidatus Phytoplasma meliae]